MSKKPNEVLSDKGMYQKVAAAGWVFFFLSFLLSMLNWFSMYGKKGILFCSVSFMIAVIFTILSVKLKDDKVLPEFEDKIE